MENKQIETIMENLKREFQRSGYNKKTLERFIKNGCKTKSLNDYSWAEIDEIIYKGQARNYFKVGDEKKEILITGEEITCRVIGINHDILADNKTNNTITFMFFIDGRWEMNETATNAGGWAETKMRTVYTKRFFKLLPQDLQNVIKRVIKITAKEETGDCLFLPSEVEITGKNEYSFAGEGKQYEFFKNGGKLPDKWFWFRSPAPNFSSCFASWDSNGCAGYSSANSSYFAPLCFCI